MTEANPWRSADFDRRAWRAAPAKGMEKSGTGGPNASPGNSFSNKDKRNLAAIGKAVRKMMLRADLPPALAEAKKLIHASGIGAFSKLVNTAALAVGMRSVQVWRRVTGGDT